VKAFPKLHALIQECWKVRRKERPNFDQIVKRLQGDIGDEIKRREEPKVVVYSKEDDEIYRGRIGKEDEIEDSEGEEDGGKGTRRGDVVSKAAHDKVVAEVTAAKDKAMQELKERTDREIRAVKERAAAEKKVAAAALEERAAEAGRWGAALRELGAASPADLLERAGAHRKVLEELEERKARELGAE
jgi:hypothetical protein